MANPQWTDLTEREKEVLTILAMEALSTKKMAERLTITHNTVETHLRNIYHKLNVSGKTAATTWFWKNKSDLN